MQTEIVIAAVLGDSAGALACLIVLGLGLAATIYAVAGVALTSEINRAITAEHEGDARRMQPGPHL